MKRKERGFTLIELMMALAVGAILLTMGVPALRMFTTDARQSAAINDFVSAMHLARSKAITTHARTMICASAGGTGCEPVAWQDGWIVFSDRNGNQAVDIGEQILASSEGSDDLMIQSGQFGNRIIYRPSGRVANGAGAGASGEFSICDDRGSDHAKALIIDLSGRPRVSEYATTGSKPGCL